MNLQRICMLGNGFPDILAWVGWPRLRLTDSSWYQLVHISITLSKTPGTTEAWVQRKIVTLKKKIKLHRKKKKSALHRLGLTTMSSPKIFPYFFSPVAVVRVNPVLSERTTTSSKPLLPSVSSGSWSNSVFEGRFLLVIVLCSQQGIHSNFPGL